MQKILFFSLLLALPFLSKGQDAATLQQLQAMGYEQVDLKALRQQQTAAPCATCPSNNNKRATASLSPSSMTATEELQNLKANLPRLRQAVADSQADPAVSTAMQQKHQIALDRALKRIQELEQITSPTSTAR